MPSVLNDIAPIFLKGTTHKTSILQKTKDTDSILHVTDT